MVDSSMYHAKSEYPYFKEFACLYCKLSTHSNLLLFFLETNRKIFYPEKVYWKISPLYIPPAYTRYEATLLSERTHKVENLLQEICSLSSPLYKLIRLWKIVVCIMPSQNIRFSSNSPACTVNFQQPIVICYYVSLRFSRRDYIR